MLGGKINLGGLLKSSVNPPKAVPSEGYQAKVPLSSAWGPAFRWHQPEMLRSEKACTSSPPRKDRPRDGPCIPVLRARETQTEGPGEEKERSWAFSERQPLCTPSATICPFSLCTGSEAGAHLLTFRSHRRRIRLVLGASVHLPPLSPAR